MHRTLKVGGLLFFSLMMAATHSSAVSPQEPFKDVAREYVIQCNVHAMRGKTVDGFDKTIFNLFTQKISDSEDKAGTCENLLNSMDHTEMENKSAIKGMLKEGARSCYNYAISWLPQGACQSNPNFLSSCHNKCREILNDACAVHSDRKN